MTIIVSTEKCYDGYDKKKDEWIGGDYLSLVYAECENIEFSQTQWESEMEYFEEFLKENVKSFEKRFNTQVLEIALCGKVGLWNHSPIGGKVVEDFNVFNLGNSVESIDVSVEDDRTITVQGHHHDGTHNMGIYFITDSVLKDTGYKGAYEREGKSSLDANFFEKLHEKRKPLKLSKNDGYFKLAA